jgi:hypothetical protein
MHCPKCGSSFLNALIHMPGFCPSFPANLSVDEHSFGCEFLKNFQHSCPDRCDPELLTCQLSAHECIGSRYEKLKGHLVGMFRRPEQRLLSAYKDTTHAWVHSDIVNTGCDAESDQETAEARPPLLEFAKFFEGTVAYQLTRDGLGPDAEYADGMSRAYMLPDLAKLPPRTPSMAAEAARRVREGFAFVGLMEEWDLSICLLHKMLGGPCHAVEFRDTRPTQSADEAQAQDEHDTTLLQGYRDELDGLVYQEAVRRFHQDLLRHNVSAQFCRDCFAQRRA